MLKELPRYDCLMEMSRKYPQLNPSACEAFMNLLRVGDEVLRVGNELFAKHNISQGRFLVLMLLSDCGSKAPVLHTPAELADKACCTRATMTGLIDTLERDGMVKREQNPEDRRMQHVTLTESGAAFLDSILPVHFERITDLMSLLSESECRLLVGLLSKVIERAGTLGRQPDTPQSEA